MLLRPVRLACWVCAALARRWRRDEGGFTAAEFALVSMPFVMLLFGIMSVCLYFFTTFTMENAVWQASRDIRTGQYQNGTGPYTGITDSTALKNKFRDEICRRAPPYITSTCASYMRVLVQSQNSVASITQPNCLVNGNLVDQSTAHASFNAGGSSSVVLVTACYKWTFGKSLPFIRLGGMADGSYLIQASAALRVEPY